jgi:hypothetical protein
MTTHARYTGPTTADLAPHHLAMLREGSGIAQEVIVERGYRSVPDDGTGYNLLLQHGFSKAQAKHRPGLLLPLWTTDGAQRLMIYRPDTPRLGKDGHAVKYELPQGAGVRLDCPPRCQPLLADPTKPLWLTEGQKKDDALASHDVTALALLGVYGFKGKNPFGGTTFLTDWDYVALNGREVRIVFDSDVMGKPTVRQALERLTEHLRRKGAAVRAVYLPADNGRKVGVDDYLAAGHTLQDLEALIEAPRPELKPTPAQVELLDESPLSLRRPLALIEGHAYAAIWPWVKITATEVRNKSGEVIKLQVPEVRTEQRLAIVRNDGVIFGEQMDKPFEALGLEVKLPEIPATPKLWQTRSVKTYRQGQRPEPKAVFGAIKTVVHRFIDFNRSLASQDTMCEMVSCYILATWFLDAFPVIGYLWPNGGKGSGKTQLLTVIAELAYLGQMLQASGSMATLRDLADYGATLCFDDAEHIMDLKKGDPDKRTLLLAGNRQGSCITVKEQGANGQWHTRYVQTFCPRLFSAIRLPDPVLASRTIIVPLIRTADPEKANADPCDYRLWPFSRASLVNDLWALAVCHLADLPRYDALVADTATLLGRNLEPWRAILAMAHWLTDGGVDGLAGRMTKLAHAYQEERRELEPPDLTAWTIQGLGTCCIKCIESATALDAHQENLACASSASSASSSSSAERGGPWIFATDVITEEVKRLLGEAQTDINPESINSQRIGKILKALRLEKLKQEKRGEARKWRVTQDDLVTHFVTYCLSLPEEIFPKNPHASQLDALDADQEDPPPASSAASSDVENRGGTQTLDALDALDDLMQTRNGVGGASNRRDCQHLEREETPFPDGSVLQRCRACRKILSTVLGS